jgi:hypothetical protein
MRQIIMRIGEPYPIKDIHSQSSIKETIVKSESAYSLGKDDLVFSGIIIDYDDFIDRPDDPDVFYEYVHCFSWDLVQGIDSPIYVRNVSDDMTGKENWRDIGMAELASMDLLVGQLEGEDDIMSVFGEHYKSVRRDVLLGKLGL